MNSLKMDDVDRVMREREISKSLEPAPLREKVRPQMLINDRIREERDFEKELKGLDNYV